MQNPFTVPAKRGKPATIECNECSMVFTVTIDPLFSDKDISHCPFCGEDDISEWKPEKP